MSSRVAKRAVDIWRTIDGLSSEGDFVADELHKSMRDPLSKFKVFNSPDGQRINMAMAQNMNKLMQKKTERENRLLWSSKSATAQGKP